MRGEGEAVSVSSSSNFPRTQRGEAGSCLKPLSVEKLYRRCTRHLHAGKLQEIVINVNFHYSEYLLK